MSKERILELYELHSHLDTEDVSLEDLLRRFDNLSAQINEEELRSSVIGSVMSPSSPQHEPREIERFHTLDVLRRSDCTYCMLTFAEAEELGIGREYLVALIGFGTQTLASLKASNDSLTDFNSKCNRLHESWDYERKVFLTVFGTLIVIYIICELIGSFLHP